MQDSKEDAVVGRSNAELWQAGSERGAGSPGQRHSDWSSLVFPFSLCHAMDGPLGSGMDSRAPLSSGHASQCGSLLGWLELLGALGWGQVWILMVAAVTPPAQSYPTPLNPYTEVKALKEQLLSNQLLPRSKNLHINYLRTCSKRLATAKCQAPPECEILARRCSWLSQLLSPGRLETRSK